MPTEIAVPQTPPSSFGVADFARDLVGEDPGARTLAARALRRRARGLLRDAERARPGSEGEQEALIELAAYDEVAAPRCIEALVHADVVGACADLLGLLETQSATDALQAAQQRTDRRRVERRIDRALDRIQAAAESGAPVPADGGAP